MDCDLIDKNFLESSSDCDDTSFVASEKVTVKNLDIDKNIHDFQDNFDNIKNLDRSVRKLADSDDEFNQDQNKVNQIIQEDENNWNQDLSILNQ